MNLSRREEMERSLKAESERWSSMSAEQLVAELREEQNYAVTAGSQVYQFEVQLLENTETMFMCPLRLMMAASLTRSSHCVRASSNKRAKVIRT